MVNHALHTLTLRFATDTSPPAPMNNAPPKRGAKNENYALLQFLKKTMFR